MTKNTKTRLLMLCFSLMFIFATGCITDSDNELEDDTIFPRGNSVAGSPLEDTFTGDVWVEMLVTDNTFNAPSYNVIFSEDARTNWHSHPGGQLLFITSGEGYYQEEGEPARSLKAGDIVEIPPDVVHWHGATADSTFEHVGVTTNPQAGPVEWFGEVTDEQYNNLVIETEENSEEDNMVENNEQGRYDPGDLTFELSENVILEEVRFKNKFGAEVAGHLYVPIDINRYEKYPAIIVGTPYGGVKEQGAGLYAQELAQRGFVAMAFDESYNGDSGGEPRHISSPDLFVEDFSAAVDFIGTRDFVDREKIGVIGICGSGGFAITAAQVDPRIKAVATASMYDISSMFRNGFGYSLTNEQRAASLAQMAEQRWVDFENGSPLVPEGFPREPATSIPEGMDPVTSEFFEYYAMERGFHPNAGASFTATSGMSFMNFPLMNYIETISPRPILFIMGENAHSRYYTEEAYEKAAEPKELVIIPGARHIDLYDGGDNDYIPFDKLESFFKENLN
ncbi:Fermentation-respiration switch protein FrsA, has esterase activity, DUF1100 family [Methanolobus vulcani]|uniref:Fermentation-respiration switch protein FrsA, has esterase activity, DUF1100 family n=1 Tax=Methanolobus vulcani TaxID=38026 RepID=A0A7Z7AV03_9EURY|nr:cupin domain-containing protein [Methanolobus vulcani]SDF33028.1 Fermentation-respiration switch protein FrsA, has esterase activity, DUF1100 family [Methanolobus vulcani]